MIAAFGAFVDANAGVEFLRFLMPAGRAFHGAWIPSRRANDFRAGLLGFVFEKPDKFVERRIFQRAVLLALNAFGQGIVGFQSSQGFHADGFGAGYDSPADKVVIGFADVGDSLVRSLEAHQLAAMAIASFLRSADVLLASAQVSSGSD